MVRAHSPSLEQLEDRLTPTTYGLTWPDPQHLTVSFVPDGTPVGSAPSRLFALLGTSQAQVWEKEMLRALQSWASQANINLTVVADDGEPLGTAGAAEGDPRFGDIRIAMAPLSGDAVAFAVPFNPDAGTWSGDILFNSNDPFSVGGASGTYDLFSVALHEAGHVFGLDDQSTDPTSAMFENYLGVRSGPSAGDIAQLQALYGTPQGASSQSAGTDGAIAFSPAALAQYSQSLGWHPNGLGTPLAPLSLEAELLAGATDVYSYRTTDSQPGFTVALHPESLLATRLTVLDADGHTVAAAQSTDPVTGDLTVRVDGASANGVYFIRVTAADGVGVFGVGRYLLQVRPDNPSALDAFTAAYAAASQDSASAPAAQTDAPADGTTTVESGTLTDAAPQDFQSVVLSAEQLLRLDFGAAATNTSAMEVTVYDDATGQVYYDAVVPSGQTATANLLLSAGTYTIRFTGGTADGSALNLGYTAQAETLGDPIGPRIIDPNNPPPRPTEPNWLGTGLVKLYALFNPYGRPYGGTGGTSGGSSGNGN